MNRWLTREILYPLHERLRGRRTLEFLKRFRQTENLTPESLILQRNAALAKLCEHAARNSPYWKKLFAELGLAPDAIRGADDLLQLPTMDKSIVRANADDLIAEGWRDRVMKLETGGSSGVPLIFWSDKDRESTALAAKIRCREWFGARLGDRQVDIWGSPIEAQAADRVRIAKDRLLNLRLLSAFQLSDENMFEFRRIIEEQRPDFIYGYSGALACYARFLERQGEDHCDLGLKVVVGTAETLFDPDRAVIERIFGCPVANEYGCRDGGYIAQECPEGNLHLNEDVSFVEILDDEGNRLPDGQVGEVVVTNLWGFGAPMLRYRLGDRAARSSDPCACGRVLPLLRSLGGRIGDTLLTPGGNRIHGEGVVHVLRKLTGIDRFQIIQDRIDHLRILLVLERGTDSESLKAPIESGTRALMGSDVKVDIEFVEEIEPLPSGKTRSVVCEVDESALNA